MQNMVQACAGMHFRRMTLGTLCTKYPLDGKKSQFTYATPLFSKLYMSLRKKPRDLLYTEMPINAGTCKA